MTATIATAVVLGIFSGLAPGPYTTLVAGTGLERGFRAALRLAPVPIVTDIVPLFATAFVLDRLNWTALTLLGIVGGTIVAMIGVRFLRRHGTGIGLDPELQEASVSFGHVAISLSLSPAPWLFWLIAGSPFLLRSLERSTTEAALFVGLFFLTNIGSALTLAWLAAHGRRILAPEWRRRALQVVGVALLLAGSALVWQSMEGNFQAMIDRQRSLRSAVENQVP